MIRPEPSIHTDECRGNLGTTLRDIATYLSGFRSDPPDMLAYLADRNVRSPDLAKIIDYIALRWPSVSRVYTGLHPDCMYLSFELNTFSRDERKRHWPIEADFKEMYPMLSDVVFYFHGPSRIPVRNTVLYPAIVTP